jgi:hypothetical protein
MCDIPRTTCVVSLLLFATAIGHVIVSGDSRINNLLTVPVTSEAKRFFGVASTDWIVDPLCATEQHNRSCTPTGKRWSSSRVSDSEPCEKLSGKRVAFVGDSYARHAYVAFLSWLSKNYRDASLHPQHDSDCEYDAQYTEKICRHQIIHQTTTCNGTVEVRLVYGASPTVSIDLLTEVDMIVWSVGRHPYNGDYSSRNGVNDAFAYYNNIFKPTCDTLNTTEFCEKVVWLDTHVRVNAKFTDEAYENELAFHIESPTWIFRSCNVRRIASVWDATDRLVALFPSDAKNMSFDGAHYGRAVNLLKAEASYEAWATAIPHC